MTRRKILVLLVLSACLTLPTVAFSGSNKAMFAAKEVLVKFKMGQQVKGNQAIKKLGAKLKERLTTIDVSRLKLPKGLTVESAVNRMSKLNIVEFAEPNYIQQAVGAPNDPSYKKQWGLKKINAVPAWSIHTGSPSTVIAIIDTGVDLDHPDLVNKLVQGYDFVDDDKKPDDIGGHGTHCAGVAAASSNNKKGVAGVCPNCAIMPIRTLGPDGGTASDTAKGIVYAVDHGAKVISMSLGTYQLSSTIRDAIEYADGKGVVIVAAAGNDNVSTPHYPAYLDQCIAVGSSGPTDAQSEFSNYGAWVDVTAPGEDIFSTFPGGKYEAKWGTSMATPFVAGLVGLMVSCPGATAPKMKQAIYNSAKPVGNWVSHGRIDVNAAMKQLGCSKTGGSASGSGSASKNPPSGSSGGSTPAPSPKAPDNSGSAATVQVTSGKGLKEPKDALLSSDDSRLTVSSKGVGFANILDFYMETLYSGSLKGALTIELEMMTANPGGFEVHLYNWKQGAYSKLGTLSVGNSDTEQTITATNAKMYINSDKRVRIRLFRREKLWNGFDLGIDKLVVRSEKGASKPSTPPPSTPKKEGDTKKEGDAKKGGDADNGDGQKKETLAEKAKKAWEKFRKKKK